MTEQEAAKAAAPVLARVLARIDSDRRKPDTERLERAS
jgi:hypothetical protein